MFVYMQRNIQTVPTGTGLSVCVFSLMNNTGIGLRLENVNQFGINYKKKTEKRMAVVCINSKALMKNIVIII